MDFKGSPCCPFSHAYNTHHSLSVPYLWISYFLYSSEVDGNEIILNFMCKGIIYYKLFIDTTFYYGIKMITCVMYVMRDIFLPYVVSREMLILIVQKLNHGLSIVKMGT